MRYLKLFENFNDDDLIKFLSNPQDITSISNKELDYLTQSDLDLIYNNLISKFIDRFNFRLEKAKGYDQLSNQKSDLDNNWIDFQPNRLVNFKWKFTNNAFIQVNKYQDDWWLVIIDAYWIFEESKKSYFGSIKFLLCDTREALLSLYDWLEAWGFFKSRLVKESIADFIDGDLMKQISFDQFCEIQDEHREELETLSQVEIDYFKSKMKSSGVPYSNWGLYGSGIIFRLNRRVDYKQKVHYTSILFEKYRDEFWLCEILSDNGLDRYDAVMNIIIDSKEGLEEFFRWVKEPAQKDYFRIDTFPGFQVKEALNLYSRPESDAVQVFESWRDFDEFCEKRESEKFNQVELPMLSKLVDNFIEIYNDHCDNARMWSENKLRSHSKFHLNYNNTVAEWEVAISDRVVAYDYNINIYKFVDDWWIIQFHLPHLSSPEGGDTLYFLCDSRDGLNDSKLVLKNYLEQL